MGRERPRSVLRFGVGAGLVVTLLTVASISWACTTIQGFTWYSDGTSSKSGAAGTSITAYATGARTNRVFNLVAGNAVGQPGHEDHACMFNFSNLNPANRISSATGFIGYTTGTVNKPAGDWQICFREPDGSTGTAPVLFTVL